MNDVGVDLAQRNQRPGFALSADGAELFQKHRPVTLNRALGVVPGKTEVQARTTISGRASARTGGKSVNQPGKPHQLLGMQNCQPRLARYLAWHRIIISNWRLNPICPPRALRRLSELCG